MNQSPMVYLSHERDALLYLSALADKYGVIPMSCIALSSSTVTAETFTRFEQDGLISREDGAYRFTPIGMTLVRQYDADRECQGILDFKLAQQQAREDKRFEQEAKERKHQFRINLVVAILALLVSIGAALLQLKR